MNTRCTTKVCDYFDFILTSDPKLLFVMLMEHKDRIISLFHQNNINQKQLDLIFPPGKKETLSRTFDIPLMLSLIGIIGDNSLLNM